MLRRIRIRVLESLIQRDLNPGPTTQLVLLGIYDKQIITAAAVGATLMIMGAVSFIPFLPVTPDGPEPPDRISLWDHYQARRSERQAESLAAQGQVEEAYQALATARERCPNSLHLLQKSVEFIPQLPPNLERKQEAVRLGDQLLRLSQTNFVDVERAFAALLSTRNYQGILDRAPELNARTSINILESVFLAQFHASEWDRFDTAWNQLETDLRSLSLLRFLRLAADTLRQETTADPIMFQEQWTQIDPNRPNYGEYQRVALRVFSATASYLWSKQIAQDLTKSNALTLPALLDYWQVLLRTGNTPETMPLAGTVPLPLDPQEALTTVRLLRLISGPEESKKLAALLTRDFAEALPLWHQLGQMHVYDGAWKALQDEAIHLSTVTARPTLDNLGKYWLGLAQWGDEKPDRASVAWSSIQAIPQLDTLTARTLLVPMLALEAAHEADKLQSIFPRTVQASATSAEQAYRTCLVARFLRDPAALEAATVAGVAAHPEDPNLGAEHLDHQLQTFQDPELLLEASTALYARHPEHTFLRVTHAVALIRNQQMDEAERLLAQLSPNTLETPFHEAAYLLAHHELATALERPLKAINLARRIAPRFLMPHVADRIRLPTETIAP